MKVAKIVREEATYDLTEKDIKEAIIGFLRSKYKATITANDIAITVKADQGEVPNAIVEAKVKVINENKKTDGPKPAVKPAPVQPTPAPIPAKPNA